jgi:RNA polymerase sigma-70 factor, ECF subfamily
MDDQHWLAERFEEHRPHLRAVAYRMLGSIGDAEDAVQESWLRLSRADSSGIANLGSWLTAVVAHVCLDVLRKRQARREESLEHHVPDPIISSAEGAEPEQEALLADSVGLALLVVLETLTPAERLSFVLHDMFAVPFDEVAEVIDRSPAAARQLASRARRRVQGASPAYSADRTRQREVVQAFLAASRNGDFEALVTLLDPDVVLRADAGPRSSRSRVIRGAAAVARQATAFSRGAQFGRLVLVNGAPGLVAVADGQLLGVVDLVVKEGRIVEMDILADPERLRDIDISALN